MTYIVGVVVNYMPEASRYRGLHDGHLLALGGAAHAGWEQHAFHSHKSPLPPGAVDPGAGGEDEGRMQSDSKGRGDGFGGVNAAWAGVGVAGEGMMRWGRGGHNGAA